MSKFKPCKLLGHVINSPPGTIFKVWGHDFVIQPNGDAVASIHQDFHETDCAAGRYLVLEEKKASAKSKELSDFTNDIGTYYGAGDLEKFREKITKLRKEGLMGFAESRLSTELPLAMERDAMIVEIINMVAFKDLEKTAKKEKKNASISGLNGKKRRGPS